MDINIYLEKKIILITKINCGKIPYLHLILLDKLLNKSPVIKIVC